MRPSRLLLVCILLIVQIFVMVPARAAMVFCNHTANPINAAFGYRETVDWTSEGWWRIEPGQCAQIYDKPLVQRFYFYYAYSLASTDRDKKPMNWGGKFELCTDTKQFKIEGDSDCESRKYHTQGFQEIDIGSVARDYTLDFKDQSDAH